MVLAVACEHNAYSSLLTLAGAVLADPEPMPARLVRGCIDMAFTTTVAFPLINPPTALLIPSRAASSATWYWRLHASKPRTARY